MPIAAVGTQYYVEVSSFGAAGSFEFVLILLIPQTLLVANAQRYQTLYEGAFTLASVPAGGSNFTPDCFTDLGFPQTPQDGVWYQFTVGVSGQISWECSPTTQPSSPGAGDGIELDWAMYDITNGCPTTANQSNEVACNFNFEGENSDPIGMSSTSTTNCPTSADPGTALHEFCPSINLTAGQTYAIFINNYTYPEATGWNFNFNGSTFKMAPVDTFLVMPDTICGDSGIVSLNNQSVAAVWQEWKFGDGDTSVDSIPLPHLYTDTGTYFITLMDSSITGCVSVSNKSVLITPYPAVTIQNDTICPGGTGTLTAKPSIPGGTYLWSPGGQTTSSISVTPGSNTPYTVTYTSPTGCTATATASVIISNNASATITAVPATICANQSSVLTATNGTSYLWSVQPLPLILLRLRLR